MMNVLPFAIYISLVTLPIPLVQRHMGVPVSNRSWTCVALAYLRGVYLKKFNEEATNPVLGDALCLVASGFFFMPLQLEML